MVSTAAFHARVRGSVPGLGGLNNGHSSNLQYLRQSRPVNHVIQRYNETEKRQIKSIAGHVRSNPFLKAFRFVDPRL